MKTYSIIAAVPTALTLSILNVMTTVTIFPCTRAFLQVSAGYPRLVVPRYGKIRCRFVVMKY
jgi:hypothetical protein